MNLLLRAWFGGAALALASPAQPPAKAVGRWFVVNCHGGDAGLARRALAAVEPVWPLCAELFGAPLARPAAPLEVHLYCRLEGYLAADRERTGGRFGANQAMSHWDSRSAHVALQPPVEGEVLAEFGLPLQTIAMLAWEACHVARFELCPNFRYHPGWFQDGLAAAVAAAILDRMLGDAGDQPFFAQRLVRAQRLLAAGRLPTVRELLGDETSGLELHDRYAVRGAFYAFAAQQHQQRLGALARSIRAADGGDGCTARMRAAAVAALDGLDAPFTAWLRAAAPTWDEHVRSLWRTGDGWLQLAFPGADAVALRRQPVAGGAFVARGRLRILAGGPRQASLRFAVGVDRQLALVLAAGRAPWIEQRDADGVHRLGGGERPVAARAPVAFVLSGRGDALAVTVDGDDFCCALPDPLDDLLVWGLAAEGGGAAQAAGSAVLWLDCDVGPEPAPRPPARGR